MTRARFLKIVVEVEGVSPLLMDAMSAEDVERILIEKKRDPVQTDLTREQRCAKKFYRNPDTSVFGIPAENFLAALRAAGRKVKVGKEKVSTADTTNLFSFLTVEEPFLDLVCQEWMPDVRRGVMKDGTTVGITRPRFSRWGFKATLDVDLDGMEGITEDTVKKLVRIAGNAIGLGAFRPTCNGPFGRFRVATWELKEAVEEEEQLAEAA